MSWTKTVDRFKSPLAAQRMGLFVEALGRFETGRLLDLGAGHGRFSLLAADLGWQVTAVDARDARFPVDDRVRWVREDVRRYEIGDVDVVACLGLWYHLTLDDQITLAKAAYPLPLIIDTHVAVANKRHHAEFAKALTRMQRTNGLEGRFFTEPEGFEAEFGSPKSFWPTSESLRRQVVQAGYDYVYALYPPTRPDRMFFVVTVANRGAAAELDTLVGRYTPFID